MRRKFYLGLALVLIFIGLLFAIWHSFLSFLIILLLLALVWLYDISQKQHSILRNFPILGHMRFILEFFRPEIQQYFIANDMEERPFDRLTRNVVYQRAKKVVDTVPFGTEHDITAVGYEWVQHSLSPKKESEVEPRIIVGGDKCKKPYSASRLNISAMSFGALSKNAILALNKGAKIGGFYHNTGEGGLSHYHLAGGGDITWQIGTGYFGCRTKDGNFDAKQFAEKVKNPQVKMVEIKLSQGAKPSHGGILPAAKLSKEIAEIRGVPLGHDVISPPAHTAFSTPKELLEFVSLLSKLSGGLPVGFKLCVGKKTEFLGICKAMLETKILPDFITVDGAEGGTGAAPLEYSTYVGTPLNDALIFVHNSLVGINLRDQIRIIASGKVVTGFDMISKIALGADMCNSARGMMMSLGCIQSRQCNINTCPTGVATQDPRLIKGLVVDDKKFRAANFHDGTMESFLSLIGSIGLENPSDLQPYHIMRRVGQAEVRSYDDIYEYLKPGDLLKTKPPQSFASLWKKATADRF